MNCNRIRVLRVCLAIASRQLLILLSIFFLAALLASCGSSKPSSQTSPLADGTYVFHLAGQANYSTSAPTQPSSPYFAVGAFTVSNGAITQGEEDFADYYSVYPAAPIQASQSSVGVTLDGNLQIKLYTGYTGTVVLGVEGVQTINANMLSATSGRIAEFDASATGTGTLDRQSSTAQPTGGYAFFTDGLDNKQLPLAFGGVINIDNLTGAGTISGTGSVFDLNDAPTLGIFSAQTFGASTASAPDSFGRVVFTLNPSNTTIGNLEVVGYIVNSSTIQLVEIRDGLLGTTGGTALSQGSATGNFSAANLSGATYVSGAHGQEKISVKSTNIYQVGSGYLQFAAALSFNSTSTVTGLASFNDIATQLANGAINAGATYSVDPTGRATVAALTTTDPNTPNTLQLYLDGNGNAFVISLDTNDVTAGVAFQQTAGASISGSYSVTASGATPVLNTITDVSTNYFWAGAGQISASSGSAAGFTDLNFLANPQISGSQNADADLAGTANGTGEILTGTIAGLGYTLPNTSPSNTYVYYVIDSNRALAIETDANQLSEVFAQSSTQ